MGALRLVCELAPGRLSLVVGPIRSNTYDCLEHFRLLLVLFGLGAKSARVCVREFARFLSELLLKTGPILDTGRLLYSRAPSFRRTSCVLRHSVARFRASAAGIAQTRRRLQFARAHEQQTNQLATTGDGNNETSSQMEAPKTSIAKLMAACSSSVLRAVPRAKERTREKSQLCARLAPRAAEESIKLRARPILVVVVVAVVV